MTTRVLGFHPSRHQYDFRGVQIDEFVALGDDAAVAAAAAATVSGVLQAHLAVTLACLTRSTYLRHALRRI